MDLSRYDNRSFDRGASWWKEGLWRVCQGLFFQPLWPAPSRFRAGLLRLFGARIGRRPVIRAGVNISFPWRLEMGDDVWLGEEVMILSLAPVRIGANVCISQRAFLCTGAHDLRKSTFDLITKPVVIGDRCWIAAGAFVGPGVELGADTVVSPGSVVLRSHPGDVMLQGNPATPWQETP